MSRNVNLSSTLLALALVPASVGIAAQTVEPSVERIRQILRIDDEYQRRSALAGFQALPPHTLSDEAVRLLTEELDRLSDESMTREDLIARGTIPEPRSNEYTYLIVDILSRQENRLAIPPLVRQISNNYSPFEALVNFGEVAVPALVKGCRTDRGLHRHLRKCLDALEQMLERPEIAVTLSDASRAQIKAVASERLQNPADESEIGPEGRRGDPEVLAAAAYLAVATKDPSLRADVVDLLSNSPGFFRAKHIDANWIPRVTELVKQALAKFPL